MNTDFMIEKLRQNIEERALRLLKPEKELFSKFRISPDGYEFILAGNSLNGDTVNDLDIYGVNYNIKERFSVDNLINEQVLFTSKNSCSIKGDKFKIQFCSYFKPTLKELVDSFDFSKIQIGVRVEFTDSDTFCVKEVYFSDFYLDWKINDNFIYTGSEYPLSSLFRLFKYYQRGDCTRRDRNSCILKILTNVIKRGFKDYDDYKDQLDAIDLMLLPDSEEAFEFYQTLEDVDLVKNKKLKDILGEMND